MEAIIEKTDLFTFTIGGVKFSDFELKDHWKEFELFKNKIGSEIVIHRQQEIFRVFDFIKLKEEPEDCSIVAVSLDIMKLLKEKKKKEFIDPVDEARKLSEIHFPELNPSPVASDPNLSVGQIWKNEKTNERIILLKVIFEGVLLEDTRFTYFNIDERHVSVISGKDVHKYFKTFVTDINTSNK